MAQERRYDLGFIGGGQLARMSIQAAQRMGLRCLSLDPGGVTPASQVADAIEGSLDDVQAISELFEWCERVTLENEFVPAEAILRAIEKSARELGSLVPGAQTLETVQDKLKQREAYHRAGVASPRAAALDPKAGLSSVQDIGFPMVLKARFGGYDGKGTRYARTPEEFEGHRLLWEQGGWLAEEFVAFQRELAVMVVVDAGKALAFPTVETVQTNHVCDLVFPSGTDASSAAMAAARAVGGNGLFGVELFETAEGAFLVNEIAPRPHNTGHYTLDWGGPSQFEAHVRVAMGLPQIDPRSSSYAVMANLLGQPGAGDYRAALPSTLEDRGVFVHWYGKADAVPGRKMGHINVAWQPGETVEQTVQRAVVARERFYRAWTTAPR